MREGTVFNIQKLSIHDGPGIRSTVFFKGCPLSCIWCSNPESKQMKPQLAYFANRCIHCGACAEACPNKLISINENRLSIEYERCDMCLSCVDTCCTNALQQIGKVYTVSELLDEIRKDEQFYRRSGGGVTFSGGEPLVQAEFLIEVLMQCKENNLHTALETTGYADTETLEKVAGYLDLIYYDIKHMDSEQHKQFTGAGNELILYNLRALSKIHNNIIVRTPIIPDLNDSEKNLCDTARFCADCGIKRYELLPYHNLGSGKYWQIGASYTLSGLKAPDREALERLSQLVNEHIGDPDFICEIVD